MSYSDLNVDLSSCKPAKRGARFVSVFLDYLLVFILSFAIFGLLGRPIYNSLPFCKNAISTIEERSDDVLEIIKSTGLQKEDEKTKSLISIAVESEDLTKLALQTSMSYYGLEYYEIQGGVKNVIELKEEEKLNYCENGVYKNNPVYNYYLHFKKQNEKDYSEYIECDLQFANCDVLKLNSEAKELVSSSFDVANDLLLLNQDATEKIFDYLTYGSTGEEEYNLLYNVFGNALSSAILEVETLYTPYIEAYQSFQSAYLPYRRGYCLSIILSYFVGFILSIVILPLILKKGRTFGQRIYSLCPYRIDDSEMRASNYIVRDLILFIEFFNSIFFIFLLMGDLNSASTPLFSSVTVFQVVLFSFLVMLVSLIFFFCNKKKQTLADFASLSLVVNTKERYEDFYKEQEKKEIEHGKRR